MGRLADIVNRKIASSKSTNSLVDVYDAMMVEYGWIPPEDFLKLPQGLINALVIRINKRREQENKAAKRKR
jgi:hypothetical protein